MNGKLMDKPTGIGRLKMDASQVDTQSCIVVKNLNGDIISAVPHHPSYANERFHFNSSFPETIQFSTIPQRTTNNNELFEYGKNLLEAANNGNVEEIKSLLEMGAPISTDWLGTSPLHMAAKNGHTGAVEFFLKTGVCRDARTKVDRTPLHFAAQHGHTEIVTLLVKHGCELDAQDMLKMTPLHWAVENQHKATVERFLEFGANTQLENKFLKIPLDVANDKLDIEITQMLLDAAGIKKSGKEKGMIPNCEGRKAQNRIQEALQQARSNTLTKPMQVMYKYLPANNIGIDSSASQPKRMRLQEDIEVSEVLDFPELGQLGSLSSATSVDSETLEAVKMLEQEGIYLTPEEPSNVVSNAIASGQKVRLTAAGMLALSATGMKETVTGPVKKQIIPTTRPIFQQTTEAKPHTQRKVLKLTESQFRALTAANPGKSPIFVKLPRGATSSSDSMTSTSNGPIISKPTATDQSHLGVANTSKPSSTSVVYYHQPRTALAQGMKPGIKVIQMPKGSQGLGVQKRIQIIPSKKGSESSTSSS